MKIYISGRITGNKNYISEFNEAEGFLKLSRFEVVNPIKENRYEENKTWKDYMIQDIKLLLSCDAIYMLSGWRRSKGARLEHYIAKKLGLKIYIQEWM